MANNRTRSLSASLCSDSRTLGSDGPRRGSNSQAVKNGQSQGERSEKDNDAQDKERKEEAKGRVAGGYFLDNLDEESTSHKGPLKKVGCDMPLTLTREIEHRDQELILLAFSPDDPEDPFNWSQGRKRFITFLLCGMTLFIGLATTAYSSGIDSMVTDLHTSVEIGELGLFLFNIVCAITPLFLAPICELVGRKVVYTGAYLCFTLCFIGLALAKNMATILVMRALLGLFGCVGTILVGGTFSDMYPENERARPMALFSYCAILGTVAAPIYAGFIDETIGWRWIEGIQGLSNIPLLILVICFLRETRGGVTLQKRAKELREKTGDDRYRSPIDLETESLKDMLHQSSVKAIKMLLTEPVVFAFGFMIMFAWGVTFIFLSVISITFVDNHSWNEGIAGLPYIALVIGTTLAYAANFLQIRKRESIERDPDRQAYPESRLYGAMVGAPFLPIGLYIYSFTQYASVSWAAPAIALAPIAIGIFFFFESTYSYTTDCYGASAGSAIAAQGLLRNTLGAVGPLFATQFFENVGSQYAGLILAVVATPLAAIPWVFYTWGPRLRERSKLAKKF